MHGNLNGGGGGRADGSLARQEQDVEEGGKHGEVSAGVERALRKKNETWISL